MKPVLTNEQTSTVGLVSSLFGFALMAAYWPGISGVATTPRWIVGALLSVWLFFAPKVRFTPAHWTSLVLIGWLLLSLIWSEGRLDGIDCAFKLAVIASAFAIGSTLTDLRPLVIGASFGIFLSSMVVLMQWTGWNGIETLDGGYGGLFFNPGRLAGAASLVLVGVVACRLWVLVPVLLPSLLLTNSRAAWIAVVAGILVLTIKPVMWRKVPAVQALLALPLVFAIVGALIVVLLRGFDGSTGEHFNLWRDTIAGLTVYGHGLGSFWESFPTHAHYFDLANSRPDHPHNEWLDLAWSGGAGGLALGVLFSVFVWRSSGHAMRAVLAALGVLSLFASPFHDPATVLMGSCCAGFLVGRGADVRNLVIAGGSPLRERLAAADAFARQHG
jgi:hypothetical protein